MSAETVMHAALSGVPAIVDIVGTNIWPVIAKNGQVPAMVFRRANTIYENTISNTVIAQKVSFNVWCLGGVNVAVSENLADLVEAIPVVFVPTNRTHEYEEITESFATVVTVDLWV